MNIYLISQDINSGYDTFSSAVVIAETEDDAKNIHPRINGRFLRNEYDFYSSNPWNLNCWANNPDQVKVKLLGKAVDCLKECVICSNFFAG